MDLSTLNIYPGGDTHVCICILVFPNRPTLLTSEKTFKESTFHIIAKNEIPPMVLHSHQDLFYDVFYSKCQGNSHYIFSLIKQVGI